MRLPPRLWNLLHSRKFRIGLAASPFVLAALIALAYPIMDQIGRWVWERQKKRFQSRGLAAVTRFEYSQAGSSAQTDLFQHPAMLEELQRTGRDSLLSSFREETGSNPALGTIADPGRWGSHSVASPTEGALGWLADHAVLEAQWKELRPAFQRTDLVWPDPGFRGRHGPGSLSNTSRFGAFHAVAEVIAGDAREAFEDVSALIDLERLLLEARPLLISNVTSVLVGRSVREAIWEGIARGAWKDEDLAAFDRKLAALEPQRSVVHALRGELAWGEPKAALLPEPIDWKATWTTDLKEWPERLHGLWLAKRPRGLEWLEEIQGRDDMWEMGIFSHGSPRESFSRTEFLAFKAAEAALPAGSPVYLKSGSVLGLGNSREVFHSLSSAAMFALTGQAEVSLLRTGIAIERFRLRYGHPPADLVELVPEFLPEVPIDPFADGPFSYRLEPDGSPLLWSYGIDCTDESGGKGDIVWAAPGVSR